MNKPWTKEMIKEYFDTHWDINVAQLSRMAMRSKSEIIQILNER